MTDHSIAFQLPWFLTLLALAPVLWWWSYRRLAVLGRWRRLAALTLRSTVLALLVLAAAEAQWVRLSDRLTVIYLLDQSLSIPDAQRQMMIDYVNESITKHREQDDRVGVIVFGREAAIEIPPFDDDVQLAAAIESPVDPEHTNIAAAMKLAQASFFEDAAKRVVVVTDGNENLGDAVEHSGALAAAGIGIDVVPIRYQRRAEVIVERLSIPSDVRRGQPFDLKVVVTNTTEPAPGRSGEIPGRLVLSQLVGDRSVVLSDEAVVLPPGKRVFSIRQQIEDPAFYKYDVRFIPDRPEDDALPQNNRATTFTHVRGKGQVLLVEDHERRGQFDVLADRLRKQNLEVTIESTDGLFASLAELQPFDTVLLGDVPRERFSDAQIEMLVRNTQQMGAGLIMFGGPNSFGAGGWTNTKLEEAMPVDFQIKSAKVLPRGALAMLMHASEIPQGNYWQKVVAKEALKALGPRDYCGVVHWQGKEQWLWAGGLREVGSSRKVMLAYLDRMTPGDMPTFDPSMRMAHQAFNALADAAIKHMIVISDGDPSPPSPGVVTALKQAKVTVTTVAVGAHGPAGSAVLEQLASATGGKYYEVRNANTLPRIFQREARRIARPLVYENSSGIRPRIRFPHEILGGIDDPLPPVRGYVMTTVKQNPLVEVSLIAPEPAEEQNSTILASWTYGLGKAAAFTTDAGARWASDWTGWDNYDKLFGQLVRWSMRPSGDTGKFSVVTRVENGQAEVIVTALDKDDEFLNFLNMGGSVVGPDLKPIDLRIRQTAPGRYVGTFPASDAGSYFVMVSPGPGQAPIRAGMNVPYSGEFRDRLTNEALLDELAAMTPRGGQPGMRIEATDQENALEELLEINTFRHDLPKATSRQDAWHSLVLVASCVFFFDVLVRRVHVHFYWVPAAYHRARDFVLRRPSEAPQPEFIQRLRSRKAAVSEQLDQRHADARFELPTTTTADAASIEELETPSGTPQQKPTQPSISPDQKTEEESYTERLLRAKKKVWEERKDDDA